MNKRLIIPLLFFLSFFITSAFALNIDPTQETYVSQRFPTGNYSTICSYDLKTGPSNEWAWTYLKFNISGIPANATIINAYVSLYQLYSRTGTNRFVEAYNTTNNWTQYNITWNVKHDVGTLQSNTSGVSYVTTGRKNFTVTPAIVAAYASGIDTVSVALRDNVNASAILYWADFGAHRCEATDYGYLVVNYNITDCGATCACGCNAAGTGCAVHQVLTDTGATSGAFALNDGTNNIYCYQDSVCTNDVIFTCPNGTSASQVTPYFNSTTYPTTPGASANCDGCWFINLLTGWPPHWQNVRTNCPADPECNCYGPICSGNIYQATNISDTPYTITEWTAGCYNSRTGNWTPLINSTCLNTTLTKIVNDTCLSNCTLGNNTPGITTCPVNTTTVCHDANCLPVTCSGTPPSTTCSSNSGGQLALALGSVMGITDCSLAQGLLAIVASIAVGFAMLYYTKDSEHGGQAFIFSTLIMLVMFTLISWFPAWLMVIMIVLGGYLVAKSMGFGGS